MNTRLINLVAFAALALAAVAQTAAAQDLRSPDTRERGTLSGSDLRSPDTQERSGAPVGTHGLDAIELIRASESRRGTPVGSGGLDMIEQIRAERVPSAQPVFVSGGGFDWTDAGIGAVGGLGLVLLLAGTALAVAHRRSESVA